MYPGGNDARSVSQISTTSSSVSFESGDQVAALQHQHDSDTENISQDETSKKSKNTTNEEIKQAHIPSGPPPSKTDKTEHNNEINTSHVIMCSELPSCESIADFELTSSASLEEARTPRRATTTPALLYETRNENLACHEAKRVVSMGNSMKPFQVGHRAERMSSAHYSNDTASLPSLRGNVNFSKQNGSKAFEFLQVEGHLELSRRSKCDMDVARFPSPVLTKICLAKLESLSNDHCERKGLSTKEDNQHMCIKNGAHVKNDCSNISFTPENTDLNNVSTPRFSLARLSRKIRGMTNCSPSASVRPGVFGFGRLSIHLNSHASTDASEKVITVLKQALSGRSSLDKVLDAIESRPGKLSDVASSVLQKYLCSGCCIDATLSLVLNDTAVGSDAPLISRLKSTEYSVKKRGDQAVQLYISASSNVRRAFFTATNVCSRVLHFFAESHEPTGSESDSTEVSMWIWRAEKLAQLLTMTLSDKVFDVTEMLSTKQGCLKRMATTFCSISVVSGFLIKLCVSDALSLRGSNTKDESLIVGEANASGIILLEKEKVSDELVSSFVSACDAIRCGNHSAKWAAQASGAVQSIFEMCRRVMLLPRYSENNCTYSPKFIVEVNCALGLLGLWGTSKRIGMLLDKGLDLCLEPDENAYNDIKNTGSYDSVIKSTPLITVMTHVTELLATVHRGRQDSSAAVKRVIEGGDIGPTVRCVVNRGDRLLKVIESHHTCLNAKASAVRLFTRLLQSDDMDVYGWFIGRKVAPKLVTVTGRYSQCCMLHSEVTSCVRASIGRGVKQGRLVRTWVKAVLRDDRWKSLMDSNESAKWTVLARIVRILGEEWDTCLEGDAEMGTFGRGVRLVLSWGFETETPCGGSKPQGPKVCILANAESLAARIHDVNAI